ncbi:MULTISPECIES: caspase domain-containing protein [unclassified Mesorhizobium]|uniref:caspase family protein n=1 Tax=unclassified Mesorhizobium TaxID=325217 RepID=UPI00112BDEB2|nr:MULTISPECIES: caspase family protein [unclassified Mesorhizobium]MBZ9810884.1 caspase family protein [Mesorhizobium sp. ESP-6-2]TPM27685.1 caspase family protein [Mesorhizobium sp. B2-2-2]
MTHCNRLLFRVPLFLLFLLLGSAGARAAVEQTPSPQPPNRLAIVIGNSNYQSSRLEHLPNAVNDATRLSESLKRLNFEVLTGTDLSSEGFSKLLREADARLPTVSAVLIFYAGHGVQLNGENYLLPVDTPDPESLEKLTATAIKLNDVIARFGRRDRQTFIFLDACRNNPLGAGSGNGLAQVEVGENTFVAFATQPGNVTADGGGENSPFTVALLKNLEIPGLSISDMMIRVRNETEALTVGRQVPWDQSNLREQFYFTEQQVLDPAQLSASLSRILADPTAKKRLQVELASNDLQTAVLIVGQTLRSVEIPAPSAVLPEPVGTQVANLSPNERVEDARRSVVSGLETLIVGASAGEPDKDKTGDLARNIQTELRRLGCYRMQVDGDWGKGSVRALTDYYRNTKQVVTTAEPSVGLLGDLFLRSGRICKQPVIVKPKPAKVASDAVTARPSPGGKTAKRSQTAPRRPAPPPPDISGGIGIGGVF